MDHLWINRLFVMRPSSCAGMFAIQSASQTRATYCGDSVLKRSCSDIGEYSKMKFLTFSRAAYGGTGAFIVGGTVVGIDLVG